ncbi:MAG TPA: electron transport complex subunit RsxE [Clostridiales bacterium]|nr:electron transport complex subunit RsxE [Clostridiales bacterium]
MPPKKVSLSKVFSRGLVIENPVLRLILGTCPTLAISTSVINGIGMGLAATFVLIGSNLVISALRRFIPDKVRIPAFITIIAGFVTIVQLIIQAFLPALDAALGIYLPLITVNCIILARAEMFACKNSVLPSIVDGAGMGIGFTAALFCMATIREVLGNGSFMDIPLPMLSSGGYVEPVLVFILPPGGFFVFGVLVALAQKLATKYGKKENVETVLCAGAINDQSACALCGGCGFSDGPMGESPAERLERQARERQEARENIEGGHGQ